MKELQIDKGSIVKILIPLDDVLKVIKLYHVVYSGLDGSEDSYMDGIRDAVSCAFEASWTGGTVSIGLPCSGRVTEVLVNERRKEYNDWRLDIRRLRFYRAEVASVMAVGQIIEKGMERLIRNIFPADFSTLKILSLRWLTNEQAILEVRL